MPELTSKDVAESSEIDDLLTAKPAPDVSEAETEQVTDLLFGKPEKEEPTDEAPEKEQDSEPETADEEVSEEESKIDYSMKIPMPGGADPVTLGELKDAYQSKQDNALELIERENKLQVEYEKVSDLLSVANEIPPEARERVQKYAQQEFQQEQIKLANILPEIATPDGREAIRTGLYELGEAYGVTKQQIDQVKDAVTIKMMHDYAKLRKSVKQAKENVKPVTGKKVKASQNRVNVNETQAAIAKAQKTHHHSDEVKAIDALFSGVK
jgi:hypothetical protein